MNVPSWCCSCCNEQDTERPVKSSVNSKNKVGIVPTCSPQGSGRERTNSLKPIAALQNSFGSLSVQLSSCLTSEKVEQDLFEHRFVDLWVGDGVQQLPLLLMGEDELTQLLPVNFAILEEDLWPEVVDDSGIGRGVWLHNCSQDS